ncbi:hypothetical protein TNCT_547951, partial [Trichonephila clavata]
MVESGCRSVNKITTGSRIIQSSWKISKDCPSSGDKSTQDQ